MVSKSWMRRVRQSKIYGESIQSPFLQIVGELNSMKSLAIYRELLVEHPLRDRSQRNRLDDRGREMFFLLRLAFWLGLVLVLLPRDKTPESEKLPQISVSEAVQAATAAVSDMSQFCKRQPAACEVGGQAATVIGVRAEQGARKIYQSITDKKPADGDAKSIDGEKKPGAAEKKAPDHTGSINGDEDANPVLAESAPHDTLTPDDLAPEWRGVQ
jgi:hypothetical protein